MLEKIKYSSFFKGNNSAGVEYEMLASGELSINYVLLKKKKNQVEEIASASGLKSIEELKACIPKNTPVILLLCGKGIINRKLENSKEQKQLLHGVLPNASPGDFYLQQEEGYSGKNFVSVIRKQAAEEVFDKFRRAGFEIVNCMIGPFCIAKILPLLELDEAIGSELQAGKHRFTVMGGKLDAYAVTEHPVANFSYETGGRSLQGIMLVPFAAALQYFGMNSKSSIAESVNSSFEEFIQKKIFVFAGRAYLSLLLFLLMINYFLFSHFSEKYAGFSAGLSYNENVLQRFDTLKKRVEIKKQFLENKGLLQGSRTSWYSDQLASGLPAGIHLERMNIHPVMAKNNTEEDQFSFEQKTITVSGSCNKSSELNEWIRQLQERKWIRDISLVNFTQDKAAEEGSFILKISLA